MHSPVNHSYSFLFRALFSSPAVFPDNEEQDKAIICVFPKLKQGCFSQFLLKWVKAGFSLMLTAAFSGIFHFKYCSRVGLWLIIRK